jgi:hypothetical protein
MSTPTLLKSFIKDPVDTSYQGRDNDEHVIFVVRKSLIAIYGWVLSFILFLIIPIFLMPLISGLKFESKAIFNQDFMYCFTAFWYLFSFGFAFQSFLNWYFEVLLVTNKKVVDIDRAATNISETTLKNIQDVTSKIHGNLEQIFNIGSIHIQTAAEREEFEFETVDDPSFVRDAISDLISEERGRHGL